MLKVITWFVIGSTLLGLSTWVGIKVFGLDKYEQAVYKVVKFQGRMEIRDYAAMIVAEGEFTGERKEAINKGFMVVASYIFGKNVSTQKVPMTVNPTTTVRKNSYDGANPASKKSKQHLDFKLRHAPHIHLKNFANSK